MAGAAPAPSPTNGEQVRFRGSERQSERNSSRRRRAIAEPAAAEACASPGGGGVLVQSHSAGLPSG